MPRLHHYSLLRWWYVGIGVATTFVPLLGVTAVIASSLLAQLWYGRLPSRRNTLAVVLATLPVPWAPLAPLWSQHPWWQRMVLVVALSAPWWPTPASLGWGVCALVSLGAVWYATQRDALRWYVPVLVLMAHQAPPLYLDVVMMTVFGGLTIWLLQQERTMQSWMALAGAVLWSMTAPGLVIAPWALALAQLPSVAVLAAVVWWGVAVTTLAAGSIWGVLVVLWSIFAHVPRITFRQVRAVAPVLVWWWAAPNLAGVARLQSALTPFGDVTAGWWVRAANQQVVAGLPLSVLFWVVVLAWAVIHQWPPQEGDVDVD